MAKDKAATQVALEQFKEQQWKQARKFGGIGWPWRDKSAFALILAVLGNEVRLVVESSAPTLPWLYEWCKARRAEYRVLDWFTDLADPAMEAWRYLSDQDVAGGRWDVEPTAAPMCGHPDELAAYFFDVRLRTMGGPKTLHFGESILPGILRQFPVEDMGRQAREYPPLAALGYVLTGVAMAGSPSVAGVTRGGWAAWT
ncbi:MAG: hypothetical protein AAGU21_00970 [Solidesulfovibrio sp.]|uniref:hypothetical protein n=1 Tax=Solidesulfovibrio sp. TaxID=2910990 RepID=UPI002B20169E|nr:hypothetical protein [Solidesulfovibrio sp.]MEA4857892.1 hypothetical protein [Solidesulfovibrio sp.]